MIAICKGLACLASLLADTLPRLRCDYNQVYIAIDKGRFKGLKQVNEGYHCQGCHKASLLFILNFITRYQRLGWGKLRSLAGTNFYLLFTNLIYNIMKNVTVTIGQNFDRVSNGQSLNTVFTFNRVEFETSEELPAYDETKLCQTLVNSLFRRFKAKEQGARLNFSYTKPVNLTISIDGVKAFDLSYLSSSVGSPIKFPAMLARKDEKQAKAAMFAAVGFVLSEARQFSDEVNEIFE